MLTPSAVAAAPIRIPSSTPVLPQVTSPFPGASLSRSPGPVGKVRAIPSRRMDVRLAPAGPELRERLLALAPRPEQEGFAGRLTDTLPAAEADPDREPV